MGAAFGFGLGMVLGAMLAFRAGIRYGLARHFSVIAGEHVGIARKAWAGTGGQVALFLLVVAGGILIMIVGSN